MSNRPRMPTTAEIAGQVTAMFTELEARWPGSAGRLGADAINMLIDWGEVTVQLVLESAADGGCTVSGAYLHDDGRAIVAIAQSASPGRRAFTACHELGHHLIGASSRTASGCPALNAADIGDSSDRLRRFVAIHWAPDKETSPPRAMTRPRPCATPSAEWHRWPWRWCAT